MAGHSKFKNIQFRKGAQDKKRAKLFAKISKEITVAARMAGGDVNFNPRLRTAVSAAKEESMPADNITRAIKRGTGELEGVNYEEIRYEGYGPGGVAVLVDCLTDNKNRTVADVRHAFSKFGGNLGADGSVAYLFSSLGVLSYSQDEDEDILMETAIDAGADDFIVDNDGSFEVIVDPSKYEVFCSAMTEKGFLPIQREITMRCSTIANLDEGNAATMIKLTGALEDLDDVQAVFSNADISDEILAKI